jgi:predicted nucleotidyltransferase
MMPAKRSNSPVPEWPSQHEVEESVRLWAIEERDRRPDLKRIGYFGSYARGDAGLGSHLDLVAVVQATDAPFELRDRDWDLSPLPVAADILIYTQAEWQNLMLTGSQLGHILQQETIWL